MSQHIASIGFAPDLVPLIKNGVKTLTYRIGDKYSFLNIGDKIFVHDSSTQKDFAEVEVTEKSYTTFKDLPINRTGHEIYKTKEEQKAVFTRYYGEVNDSMKILVLEFRVLRLLE